MSLKSKLIVLTAIMASLLEIIDTSIVNVAVPHMMGNLGATIDEISWVITGYIIANAIVLPIAGWMSEQYGRKFYYTTCIVLFTATSLACGLAPNLQSLVFFRIIQGLAGGALLPTSQALIYEAFPPEQAGMASAIYGMSVMIGPTIAPTLGGYLTDQFGWRSIFNINVPIGIVVAFMAYFLVDDLKHAKPAESAAGTEPQIAIRKRRPVDSWGLLFLVVGIGCLQYVLERGNSEDWFDSKSIFVCSILAVAGIIALIVRELRTAHPILELRHFKNSVFSNGVFLMMALGGTLYGLLFLLPIFVNNVLNFTATQTGFLFLPGALAAASIMPFIGKYLKHGDPRLLIMFGFFGLSTSFYFTAHFDSDTSANQMFWPLLMRGVSTGMLFVPINNLVLTQFRGVAVGQVAGMLNLFRQLGGSFAIAMASTLFQRKRALNYSVLSEHITPFNFPARLQESQISHGFQSRLPFTLGMDALHSGALKVLYLKTQLQGFILAYQEIVMILSIGGLLALIPLALMKKPTLIKGEKVDLNAH